MKENTVVEIAGRRYPALRFMDDPTEMDPHSRRLAEGEGDWKCSAVVPAGESGRSIVLAAYAEHVNMALFSIPLATVLDIWDNRDGVGPYPDDRADRVSEAEAAVKIAEWSMPVEVSP